MGSCHVTDLRMQRSKLFTMANEEIRKAGFYNANNQIKISNRSSPKRELIVLRASSRRSQDVDTINGRKVNGFSIDDEASNKVETTTTTTTLLVNNNNNNKADSPMMPSCLLGRFVEDRFVYRQAFIIRSYEIGPDKTATMETLMNLLQETALNHVTSSGLAGDGFGATREMSLRKLIWVVTRINIQVDKYSSWGDFVEIDTWVDAEGRNGMRRDWIIREYNTQKIITRATSTWVTMNRETRRLSKIPDQVKREVKPFYTNKLAIVNEDRDTEKIDKLTDETAKRIRSGLAPRWSDMDANQHVNNVKYIGWVLESMPINVLQDYDLTSMTMEFRRECQQSNLLESLTSIKEKLVEDANEEGKSSNILNAELGSIHLLRLQDDKKEEIIRARSEWRSKSSTNM